MGAACKTAVSVILKWGEGSYDIDPKIMKGGGTKRPRRRKSRHEITAQSKGYDPK